MTLSAIDLSQPLSRRALLSRAGTGLGMLGLVGVLGDAGALGSAAFGASTVLPPQGTEGAAIRRRRRCRTFAAKAKHVIHIYLNGGPSQVDTFDPKPLLTKYSGRKLPAGNLSTERPTGAALGSPFQFKSLRAERPRVRRDLRQDGPARRRHLRHPLDVLQHAQSRAVDAADEHGGRAALAAELRLVAVVRHGDGQPEPARLYRDVPGAAGLRRLELAIGLSPGRLSGDVHRHAADTKSTS